MMLKVREHSRYGTPEGAGELTRWFMVEGDTLEYQYLNATEQEMKDKTARVTAINPALSYDFMDGSFKTSDEKRNATLIYVIRKGAITHIILTNTDAFVLNEAGKTVEKLVPSGR